MRKSSIKEKPFILVMLLLIVCVLILYWRVEGLYDVIRAVVAAILVVACGYRRFRPHMDKEES